MREEPTVRGSREPLFPYALLEALREEPGSPAFEHGERIVSRGELMALIGRLAAALRAAGLGPGRGLAVSLAVSPEAFAHRWPRTCWAAVSSGCGPVTR